MNSKHLRIFFIPLLTFFTLVPVFSAARQVKDVHITQLGEIVTEGSPATVTVNLKMEKAFLFGTTDRGRTGRREYRYSPTSRLNGYYIVSPLSNLKEKHLTLYEGGRDKISSYESDVKLSHAAKNYKIYSVLLIDLSGSITANLDKGVNKKSLLDQIKTAVRKYVKNITLTENSKLAIYAFDGRRELIPIITFSSDEKEIEKNIEAIDENFTEDASTNLYGAVVQGLDVLKEAMHNDTSGIELKIGNLTVFTDGTDRAGYLGRDGKEHVITRIRRARKDDNIFVFSIGLGREYDRDMLQKIGRDGFRAASGQRSVNQAFKNIADQIEGLAKCFYTLEYKTPTRVAGEKISLKIEVTKGGYKGHILTSFELSESGERHETEKEDKLLKSPAEDEEEKKDEPVTEEEDEEVLQ